MLLLSAPLRQCTSCHSWGLPHHSPPSSGTSAGMLLQGVYVRVRALSLLQPQVVRAFQETPLMRFKTRIVAARVSAAKAVCFHPTLVYSIKLCTSQTEAAVLLKASCRPPG